MNQNLFDVIRLIGETSSTNEKKKLLKYYATDDLADVLRVTYDPFMTYRVNQMDFPDVYNDVQPNVTTELVLLAEELAKHTTTPAAARLMIKNLMSKCTEDNAKIVARVFRKDLKIGVTAKTVNKVFPGLVKEFQVQLANPIEQVKQGGEVVNRWERVSYPCCVEEKYDGMRIIAVCDGHDVKYFSREGHEYTTLDFITPQIIGLRPGTRFVLDGEAIGTSYNPECKPAKKAHARGDHWEFAQGLSMVRSGNQGKGKPYPLDQMKAHVGLIVWDLIDYDYFLTQGREGEAKPLTSRKAELFSLFDRADFTPRNLVLADNHIASSMEDVKAFTKEVIAKGGEGSMVKDFNSLYEFKRSDAVLKVKEFKTADLEIIDAVEGKDDTKYVGMLGALLVSDGTVTAEVGSGFDDFQRVELWDLYRSGELAGMIAEIKYFEITSDDSLRLPTFLRLRPEKSDCSWN